RIEIDRVDDPDPGDGESWKSIVLPPPGACSSGALAPVRALALDVKADAPDDLARARAVRDALRSWMPFAAAGDPGAPRSALTPQALVEDCRKPTPLACRGWEGDLVTAACLCTGLLCRSVSSAAAGATGAGLEGFEVWSRDLGRWIYLAYDERGRGAIDPAPPSAATLAAEVGVPVAIALDLRWGLRGWVVAGATSPPAGAHDP